MERRYTNQANLALSVAVFLATDDYDHEDHTISATSFLKSTRQLILSQRVPEELSLVDLTGLVNSRIGSAVHNGIEQAWLNNPKAALKALGHPQAVIDKIKVNPDPATIEEDDIPIYLEQRAYREIDGYTVSGKFDFVDDGRVEDFKNTGTFAYTSSSKDEDYIIQGSIYRWLNPEIITDDYMAIHFIFKDWMAARARTDPNYPQSPIATKKYPLMLLSETENFIRNKLRELEKYKDSPEKDIPLCSDKDLWRTEPVFKYYKNPDAKRATKNYDNLQDANNHRAREGKGVVVEVPGEVKACRYCNAYPICTQKDDLIADGSFKP